MDNTLPDKVIEFLGGKENITSHIMEHQKKAVANDVHKVGTKTLVEIIMPFYESRGMKLGLNKISFFIGEPLKNANFYSGNDKPIIFGIFLSEKGLVASYNDSGEYFKRQDVKHCWENKIKHPDKHKRGIHGVGIGFGTGYIYNAASIIYVDDIAGTLYIGMGIDKFVYK